MQLLMQLLAPLVPLEPLVPLAPLAAQLAPLVPLAPPWAQLLMLAREPGGAAARRSQLIQRHKIGA